MKRTKFPEMAVTTDTNLFKQLHGNRDLRKSNLLNIKHSIEKNGYKLTRPVIVSQHMEVIDGQHRLEALRLLQQEGITHDFSYTIEKVNGTKGIELARDLQSGQKDWAVSDYVSSNAKLNIPDYVEFRDVMKEYHIPATILLMLIHGSASSSNMVSFKRGDLNITNWDVVYARLRHLEEIEKIYVFAKQVNFVKAMLTFWAHDEFDNDEFCHKLNIVRDRLYRMNFDQYKLTIAGIYNYKRSKKINFNK